MKTVIISLGGSIIVPNSIDKGMLTNFKKLILEFTNTGNRAIIVTGGGSTSRKYQDVAAEFGASKEDQDWIGIAATKINAHLVRSIFGNLAFSKVLDDPSVHIETDKKIIIGSGHKPGCSSDKDAVILAKTYGANSVVNMTNVDHVYDKNPHEFDDAIAIKSLSWNEFSKMFGTEWKPGLHAPFDPIAALEAKKNNTSVIIMRGFDNLKNFLMDSEFKGTIIK